MIRRLSKAERGAKAKRKAQYRRLYRKSALAKGPSRQALKAMKDALETAAIRETRATVWCRTICCELCGWSFGLSAVRGGGELHEDPSRAKTRGRPPRERFNERGSCRACPSCHADQTEKRAWVDFADPVRRFLGAYTVRRWTDDAPLFHQAIR